MIVKERNPKGKKIGNEIEIEDTSWYGTFYGKIWFATYLHQEKPVSKIINSKIDKKQQQKIARKFFAIFSNKRHMFPETEKNAWTEKDCNLITIFL